MSSAFLSAAAVTAASDLFWQAGRCGGRALRDALAHATGSPTGLRRRREKRSRHGCGRAHDDRMCRSTAGGTSPVIGCPSAQRARMAVDDTSGVGRFTRKIDGASAAVVRRAACQRRIAHARRERGQHLAHARRRPPGPVDHDEMRSIEEVRVVAPGCDFCKRVGARDEEKLRRVNTRCACSRCSVAAVYDGPGASSSMSDARSV